MFPASDLLSEIERRRPVGHLRDPARGRPLFSLPSPPRIFKKAIAKKKAPLSRLVSLDASEDSLMRRNERLCNEDFAEVPDEVLFPEF